MTKIEELKKKFAGTQNDRQNQQNNINSGDIKSLEAEIAKQVCKKTMFVLKT